MFSRRANRKASLLKLYTKGDKSHETRIPALDIILGDTISTDDGDYLIFGEILNKGESETNVLGSLIERFDKDNHYLGARMIDITDLSILPNQTTAFEANIPSEEISETEYVSLYIKSYEYTMVKDITLNFSK